MITAEIILKDGRSMKIELFPEHAPLTVENFVALAKSGFYDGLCFHRVIKNFMIQGGGFEFGEELKHKPAKTIKGEFALNKVNNPLRHTKGTVSMARAMDKDSASSQFFICVADCDYLDGQYAAFGRIADEQSQKVADDISAVKTGRWMHFDDVPTEPVVMETIKIYE